jgi:hypothetical protein
MVAAAGKENNDRDQSSSRLVGATSLFCLPRRAELRAAACSALLFSSRHLRSGQAGRHEPSPDDTTSFKRRPDECRAERSSTSAFGSKAAVIHCPTKCSDGPLAEVAFPTSVRIHFAPKGGNWVTNYAGSFLLNITRTRAAHRRRGNPFAAAQHCGFHDAALTQIVLGFTFGHGEYRTGRRNKA